MRLVRIRIDAVKTKQIGISESDWASFRDKVKDIVSEEVAF